MSLTKVNFANRERLELPDMQALSDLPLANLAQALQAAFGTGILRGAILTASNGLGCLLSPFLALDDAGKPLHSAADIAAVFAANGAAHPRIDLVTIKYAEHTTSASRTFINNDNTTNDTDTVIRTSLNDPIAANTVTVYTGTAAADPEVPATPVGEIPVATVTLPALGSPLWTAGADVITDAMIRMVGPRLDAAAVFYPRVHRLISIPSPINLPLTHTLFTIPTLPATVVGIFNLSFTWHFSTMPPGEVECQVKSSAPGVNWMIAEFYQTIPETPGSDHITTISMHGIIPPGTLTSPYDLVLRKLFQGGESSGITTSYIELLQASVIFAQTIAPWPGLV